MKKIISMRLRQHDVDQEERKGKILEFVRLIEENKLNAMSSKTI